MAIRTWKLLSILGLCAVWAGSNLLAEIKLGIAAPLTGSQAKIGTDMAQGAELAVAEWNSRGGIRGEKIVVVKGDDEASPTQAPVVARDLVSKGVVGVVGHFNSGCTIPASEIYD